MFPEAGHRFDPCSAHGTSMKSSSLESRLRRNSATCDVALRRHGFGSRFDTLAGDRGVESVGSDAGVPPREDRAHARVSAISPALSVWRSQRDLEQDTELVGDVAAHPRMDLSLLVIELGRISQRKHAFVPYVRVDV